MMRNGSSSALPNCQQEVKSCQENEVELCMQAIKLSNALMLPMILRSALELKIIDILSEGNFLSASEIAARISAKNPNASSMLDRMLRLLASYSILECKVRATKGEAETVYGAGGMCKFLVRNEEGGSVGPLILLHHDKVFIESWNHLNDAVLKGGVPFNRAYGMTPFEYCKTDERFNQVFNQAMSNCTPLILNKMFDIYKGFQGLNVLVDVGGGFGVTLNLITSKFPHIKGINFDLSHVIAVAPSYPGVEHVAGSMFVSVPKGGDAILMKFILHDFSDEHCVDILRNCFEALPDTGKVIVMEALCPETADDSLTSTIVIEQDLMMLTQLNGKERTRKEYEAMALKSGFSSCQVICYAYHIWVIEFHK